MNFLFAAILFSASIGLLFKYSENNHLNRFLITSTNYFVATLISLIGVLSSKIDLSYLGQIDLKTFIEELFDVINNNNALLNVENSLLFSIILGVCTGWLYYLAFIYYQKSVAKNGISLSAMFSRLGILIPMIIAVFIWKEIPTLIQFIGIIMSLFSIILANINFGTTVKIHKQSLLSLFFFAGFGVFGNKIFQKYALIEQNQLFLFCIFGSALIISIKYLSMNFRYFGIKDIAVGIFVGISNLLTTLFLIQALDSVAAAIVFPVFSAGAIVLMMLGGQFLFKERIARKNLIAIFMTLAALIIINV